VGRENGLSGFHGEVLPELQRRVLAALGRGATREGFYLGGGTAIALHLGHRQSVDFDWFTPAALDDPLELADRIRSGGVALEATRVEPGTLHDRLLGVPSSFFRYGYPLLRPAVPWPEFSCELASLEDLACMKLVAVAQRGARKDLLDVFAIGRDRIPLALMLELYRQKYGIRDVGHVLAGLSYFDDAEREPVPVMLVPMEWAEVKATLATWVRGIAG
jgi:hypothetical protein